MKTTVVLMATLSATVGCMPSPTDQPEAKPTEEFFFTLPYGLPIDCGNEVREAILNKMQSLPAGTHVTFLMSDNQAMLGTMEVPKGGNAYKLDFAEQKLEKALERLDPELSGGALDVDLISISSSVRKYRKTNHKPTVFIVGSPLVVDREQGMGISNDVIPCDGCVTDESTSYGRMESFPKETTVRFLTPRQDYGRGPNHRSQIEHFLRYLLSVKGGTLMCISSDAQVVFHADESQWDSNVEPVDDCNGVKKVDVDEPQTKVFDRDGNTEASKPKPKVEARLPDPKNLAGDLNRVVFFVDTSGSVAVGPAGEDRSKVFNAIKTDVCQKLDTMEFTHFAVAGFGGWKDLQPRLDLFPNSVVSGFHWSDATRANRDLAIQFVKQLRAGGGTPTLAALQLASDLEGPLTCILYTDGVPTLGDGGQAAVLKHAKALGKQEVVIHAVGVGALSVLNDDVDWSGRDFLTRVAKAGFGDYFVLDEGQ